MSSVSASPIEVLLVDDQRAILAGVRALIESEAPLMRVAGLARNGAEALQLASLTRPDVIVLDVNLADEHGLDLVPPLRNSCGAAIVVLTGLVDAALRARAFHLGVRQFVSKAAPGEALLNAIRSAADERFAVTTPHGSRNRAD